VTFRCTDVNAELRVTGGLPRGRPTDAPAWKLPIAIGATADIQPWLSVYRRIPDFQ
jgi:hypothetical protein